MKNILYIITSLLLFGASFSRAFAQTDNTNVCTGSWHSYTGYCQTTGATTAHISSVEGPGPVQVNNLNGSVTFGNIPGVYIVRYSFDNPCSEYYDDEVRVSRDYLTHPFPHQTSGTWNAGTQTGTITITGSDRATQYYIERTEGGVYWQATIQGGSNTSTGPLVWNVTLPGTYTVYALTDVNGCTEEFSVAVGTFTLSNTPNIYTVSTDNSCGVKLSSSQQGISYQLFKDGIYQSGNDKSGTGSSLLWSVSPSGTYTVKASNGTNTVNMSGSAPLAAPTLFTLSGGGGYCPGTNGVSITLSGSQVGVTYKLGKNGSYIDTPKNGTGSALTWTNQLLSGTYTIMATNAAGCTQLMSGSVPVSIYTQPTTYTVSGGGSYFPGSNGLSITLSGSQAATSYQLKLNGVNSGAAISGTGNAISWTNQLAVGTYTIVATNANGCSQAMTGSAVIDINAGPAVPPNPGIENYAKSTTITVEGILTDADIANIPAGGKHITYQYLDGLGRPVQQVNVQASPAGYDMVQLAAYDKYGNQPVSYLPYVSSSQDGRFQTNAYDLQLAFYNRAGDKIADDAKPFAVSKLENSPSGRLLEQGAPGTDWQPEAGHTMKSDFRLNTTDDHVKIWTSAGSSSEYTANSLIVSKITDENGNHGLLFSDKMGRGILKRIQLDENITENGTTSLVSYLETYLVYDDYGRVIYQIPPKAVAKLNGSSTWTTAFINEWVFSYNYDALGRLVQKKVPGSAPVYICYDKLDRPILVQDGKSRTQNKWFYVKYDLEERPVQEGIYTYADPGTTGTTPQEKLQNYLNGLNYSPGSLISYEERQSGTTHGYTNRAFPTTGATVLSVHYYDDYDFNYDGTADYSYTAQALPGEKVNPQASSYGNLTGSKSLVMGTSNWLISCTFYDKYGQPIQSRGNNHLSLTVDNLSTVVYAFDGTVKATKAYHKAGAGKEVTVINKFEYDLKGRLKKVFQNNNNASSDQLVAQYEYNELGQLVDKKLHGTGTNFLQSVDFRYNIRGWLTHINNSKLETNDTNDESNDLFGMEFLYNTTQTGLNDQTGDKKYWNGNVSALKWKVQPDANATQNTNPIRERSYKFNYDKTGRLKQATYQAWSGTAWNVEVGGYNEAMTYDHNGNILTMTRNTLANGATTPTIADNLTYTYTAGLGNQLKKVEDASTNTTGFSNSVNTVDEYGYDENGNLSRDNNKGISLIEYNELSKISQITYTDGRKIKYLYEASGGRLRKEVFQAGATTPSKTIDYAGSFVYENTNLSYFSMAEGRVKANGSSFTYEYFITDHQGNVRVSFEAYNNMGTIVAKLLQENHYYPFGMSMTGMAVRTATPSNPNKNLYNEGSELQDDFGDSPGFYSTGFREYDPVLGRFTAVDPLADYFADWTPYTYAYNNPINFNDPTGLAGRNPKGGQSMTKPKKVHKPKRSGGGGGGGSDFHLNDYSGTVYEDYEDEDDDEVEEHVEEVINDNDNTTKLNWTSEAYEGYMRWKGEQEENSGGDPEKKPKGRNKPGDRGDLGLTPRVVDNLPKKPKGSDENFVDPMLVVIDFIFDTNESHTFNEPEPGGPMLAKSRVPVIVPTIKIIAKLAKGRKLLPQAFHRFPNIAKKFGKHGKEWTSAAINSYYKRAIALADSKIGGNIAGFTSKEGWIFRYNLKTGEFLTVKPNGIIETFFRPTRGLEYYFKQIELYGK